MTGATGAVGPAVANRLARDASVVALARHTPASGALASAVRFESADLLDSRAAQLVRDADVVCHLAAKLHVNDPGASLRAEYERTNVEATKRLVDATPPASRFIFFSTIDVYGPTPPGVIADEGTPPQPRSLYGETKLQAEQAVLAHPGGLVLRMAAVYGPRVKANYARLVRALELHRYISIGPGDNKRTLIYEDDVAEAAAVVASAAALPSRLYNLTDGAVHSVREIVDAISGALDRRPPRGSLPAPMIRGAASVLDATLRLVGRRSPVTPQMIDKLQENVAVSGARLPRESAFSPRVDLAAGWRAAIASHDRRLA
ncbi:MAG TPA: NAD-dependent epimerase/dehydratase family protein [Vicinamibacterales bacterium]|nr:NAD-dependent epimerase/dehydratase family protein [Vicinamibacterales bacterium]